MQVPLLHQLNKDGLTPLDLAKRNFRIECEELLKRNLGQQHLTIPTINFQNSPKANIERIQNNNDDLNCTLLIDVRDLTALTSPNRTGLVLQMNKSLESEMKRIMIEKILPTSSEYSIENKLPEKITLNYGELQKFSKSFFATATSFQNKSERENSKVWQSLALFGSTLPNSEISPLVSLIGLPQKGKTFVLQLLAGKKDPKKIETSGLAIHDSQFGDMIFIDSSGSDSPMTGKSEMDRKSRKLRICE